jgi:hypothetical protein
MSVIICMSNGKVKVGTISMHAVMLILDPWFMGISLTEVASGATSAWASDVGATSPPTPNSPSPTQQRYWIGACCCLSAMNGGMEINKEGFRTPQIILAKEG